MHYQGPFPLLSWKAWQIYSPSLLSAVGQNPIPFGIIAFHLSNAKINEEWVLNPLSRGLLFLYSQ